MCGAGRRGRLARCYELLVLELELLKERGCLLQLLLLLVAQLHAAIFRTLRADPPTDLR